MKRNMVPLLGIAFVVAIISTGVFYGLFAGKLQSSAGELPGHSIVVAARDLDRGTVIQASDLRVSEVRGSLNGSFSKAEDVVGATLLAPVKASEPLLEERVASRTPKSGSGGLVPEGMRAVSIRVAESDGLMSLLHPGSRVDVQAVADRNSPAELRTILQNVEVLSVSPQTLPGGNQGPLTIVTVLTRAQDADVVALADSAGRIRLALRNPLDKGTGSHGALALASVFHGSAGASSSAASIASALPGAQTGAAFEHPIRLHVQVLSVSDAALGELGSKLDAANADDSLRVARFRSGEDAAGLVHSLEQRHELEVVTGERLTAGLGRPISYRVGAAPYHLRVQFAPETGAGGAINLRVKPEISLPSGAGVATRTYNAGFPDDSCFLVEGVVNSASDAAALEHLFPGHAWSQRKMVILVTAQSSRQTSAVAVVRTKRER